MRRILATAVAAVAILALAASATPNFSTCSALKAIPGNANGVSDSQCAACAMGAQAWYPCDTDGLCYCSANGGTIPPQYRLPFSGCSKAIAVVGNPNGVKDADCLQCSNGNYRYYPCDQPGTLCTCAPGYGTVVTTPSPPTTATPPTPAPPKTPAPPPSPAQTPSPPQTPAPPPTSLTDAPPTAPPSGVTPQSAVNKLSDLQQPYAPYCASLSSSGASATTCSQSYDQALCNSMLFYMAQSGGNVARGLDWRGTCFMNDVWNGRNLTLGWFDAGDYVKFGLPMAFSATALAWGALLWPAGYTTTPMTKDALLYNLRVAGFYFYNAWDANTQTLVAQIGDGTADHSTWYPCKVRTTETRIMQTISPSCPGTEVAADTASALAAIALVLQKFEGTASSTLQNQFATAALQLWNFANGANKGTYTNCVPGAKTFYDSWSGYKDELAFAGTWMYELAQKGLIASSSTYLSAAQSYYSAPGNFDWDNKMLGASLRLYAITGGATYKSDIQGRVAVYTTSGPRTAGGLISGINTWGSLREAANAAFVARYAADLGLDSGNAALLLAKRQLDYILGKNPAGRSYMVGFGANSPINAHHRSAHDSPTGSISNPTNDRHTIYGALVGGPPSSDTDYYDDRTNYQTNEVATDYNALFTGLIASFAGTWTPPSGVDASTTCSATSKGAPPAPPGPALAPGAFTITAVTLQSWYLQVKIKPQSGVQSVVITFNDGNGQCTGTGPQWPDNSDGSAQWTCSVSGSPVGTGAIAVKVSTSSGSLTKVIKEGGVALALQVSQSVAEFSSPDFVQTVAAATNVTDVSRISVTGLTAVDASNSLVNFTIDPLPFPAYTVKGEAYISNDGTTAQSTFGTGQTTTSVYSSFQIGADGQPNASSTVMQTLQTGAGVVQGTVIVINNPTYIYYAAPPKEESFATSPVGAALGGACATLIFFGGLFGGYKYAKRNKGKKQPQTVIVVVGQEGLQRALMGQEMAAASASTEPKSVECDGQIV